MTKNIKKWKWGTFEENIVTCQTVSQAKRLRKRLLTMIFPRLLPRPAQILFEVPLCLSSLALFSLALLAYTNRIDRVFVSRSSLGHVTGCKENALEFPLIWSHNDGFPSEQWPCKSKIRASSKIFAPGRKEVREIRAAKDELPASRRWRDDEEETRREKKKRTRKRSRERTSGERRRGKYKKKREAQERNVSRLSTYVNIPVTRARPSSLGLPVDEKFLTKKGGLYTVVDFVEEKRKTILPKPCSLFFLFSYFFVESGDRRCAPIQGNITRMQTAVLRLPFSSYPGLSFLF